MVYLLPGAILLRDYCMAPRKGYTPKTMRALHPLTVAEQKALVDKAEGAERTLLLLMLSTGMHPKVLAQEKYGFSPGETYYSWRRPKTGTVVKGVWSRAMQEKGVRGYFRWLRGKAGSTYWRRLVALGKRAKVSGTVCPLRLRHTYFVNKARLGHNAFDIAQAAGTDLGTVYQYYMVGSAEMKRLTDEERAWLEWLMEP